jgi:hypothetical protein
MKSDSYVFLMDKFLFCYHFDYRMNIISNYNVGLKRKIDVFFLNIKLIKLPSDTRENKEIKSGLTRSQR